jgi:hypothetical protein
MPIAATVEDQIRAAATMASLTLALLVFSRTFAATH